ncbi:hypothetical protein CLV99_2687 [Sphingobacterium yanglingense]|uniref:Uncharacterized protein n=1 Tax=Sphingobacterium yanglingense TaxID=1437280 RepID=A0A4R6WGF3_9SPHI|nr:hypothetical protein CLV99_2687 [Sphingobacterium yanglingense]
MNYFQKEIIFKQSEMQILSKGIVNRHVFYMRFKIKKATRMDCTSP